MPDTVRTIAAILGLLEDNNTGNISAQDIRDAMVSLDDTGWAQYADTQYTQGSPFSVLADTDTDLPNNGANAIQTYMPRDVNTMYADGKITGRSGDGLLITVDFSCVPTSAATTLLEVWIDIGAPVGELYRRLISFPKGNGVVRPINFTVSGYSLDTWEANGGTVKVRTDGPASIYNVRYVLTRTHRGGR